MAGWRLGFAVGNADIIKALNLIQDHLFVSVFPALQKAAEDALNDPQRDLEIKKLNQLYKSRRDAFINAAAKIGWTTKAPQGTFYAWMPVPDGYTSESFADKLLYEAGVAVAPGNGFGKYGEGYVRVGLLIDPDRLEEAVNRIDQLHLFN